MKLRRMFTTYGVKGTENYLNSQKKYELFRTLIYFSISVSLLIAGWVQTGSRANLLSIIAILGCLPASKSAVNTIMFYRFHSASKETIDAVKPHEKGLSALYDCVFTSYKKNYVVSHLHGGKRKSQILLCFFSVPDGRTLHHSQQRLLGASPVSGRGTVSSFSQGNKDAP